MHLTGIDASLAYMFWNLWNCKYYLYLRNGNDIFVRHHHYYVCHRPSCKVNRMPQWLNNKQVSRPL